MAVFVWGLVSIAFFYIAVLLVGVWAAKKQTSSRENPDSEEVMVAGRNIGLIVGIFTMTATWVGGGYINGTAEYTFSNGILQCQAPIGYALSLVVGGLFFAKKMRRAGYVTMLDPFQRKFGQRMGGLLFVPALLGEIFWAAAVLSALGATIKVILNINNTASILASACIAIGYTMFGGLYAVAYTDIIQLFCIFFGLWISIPFAFKHPAVGNLKNKSSTWVGTIQPRDIGTYIDTFLLLIFGGIPWQVYFQRVLSARSERRAMYMSYVAAIGCLFMAVPSVLIGIAAKSADWTKTTYKGKIPIPHEDQKLILPLVLEHLTPSYICFIGLGAVSAAVMSSADSSVLSASSMYARNVWKLVFRHKAPESEILLVMRIGIFFVGATASLLGILIESIYGLWVLSADLVYVILFPQLVCALYIKKSNTYGSAAAYAIGIILRAVGGDPVLKIKPLLKYPFFDYERQEQLFPFRTLSMLSGLLALISVSYTTDYIFSKQWIPAKYDIFKCVVNIPSETIPLQENLNINEDGLIKGDSALSLVTMS
ncbi:hypothetical protein ACOME3_009066 [Neoechinorhynchus agilis]